MRKALVMYYFAPDPYQISSFFNSVAYGWFIHGIRLHVEVLGDQGETRENESDSVEGGGGKVVISGHIGWGKEGKRGATWFLLSAVQVQVKLPSPLKEHMGRWVSD
jgi:hypothetical protein